MDITTIDTGEGNFMHTPSASAGKCFDRNMGYSIIPVGEGQFIHVPIGRCVIDAFAIHFDLNITGTMVSTDGGD